RKTLGASIDGAVACGKLPSEMSTVEPCPAEARAARISGWMSLPRIIGSPSSAWVGRQTSGTRDLHHRRIALDARRHVSDGDGADRDAHGDRRDDLDVEHRVDGPGGHRGRRQHEAE